MINVVLNAKMKTSPQMSMDALKAPWLRLHLVQKMI